MLGSQFHYPPHVTFYSFLVHNNHVRRPINKYTQNNYLFIYLLISSQTILFVELANAWSKVNKLQLNLYS